MGLADAVFMLFVGISTLLGVSALLLNRPAPILVELSRVIH